jgi:gluconate 2-dehydrogenase subunit 3-like protein
MTSLFLSALVDTLLPGDQGSPPLPTGTAAGVATKLERLIVGPDRALRDAVLQAIASAARGEDAFVRADAAERIASVRQVEAGMAGPFQTLVALVLRDYYEADVVLLAMGWRAEPPQPQGHVLPPFDEALLEPVRQRGRMWR